MSDDDMVRQLAARLHELYLGGTLRQAETIAIPLVNEGWTKPETRAWSLEASQRASQDAAELLGHLQRCQSQGLVHGTHEQQKNTARHLVTWGWTRIGPGEQVVAKPAPRNEELSLRDELAATIAGWSRNVPQVVGLAEHLVDGGWTKLGPDEKVVTPMSADEATQIVARALLRWEDLRDDATARGKGPNWARDAAKKYAEQVPAVSADSSELTATVKPEDRETRILSVFMTAPRAFSRVEALTLAAGKSAYGVSEVWGSWNESFYRLQEQDLLELAPDQQPGSERTYQITDAGRIALAAELAP